MAPAAAPAAALALANLPLQDSIRPLDPRSDSNLQAGHVLTGITRVNDELFATIDGRDYRLGDPVGDSTNTAVGEDGLQLVRIGPVLAALSARALIATSHQDGQRSRAATRPV